MATAVSAFGYSVPLLVVVVVLALVIGLALAVMFWLTMGLSVYRSIRHTREQRVRDGLQDRLLDGVFSDDPEWESWVADLSGVERDVLEDLLDEYLRELDGENVTRLQDLGVALGIPDRARRRLEGRNEFERLYALTWLTLLERPGELRAAAFTPRTPRERAAAARLRYETDDLDSPAEGISLMLSDTTGEFSVFGQDTLYRIAADDPGALLRIARENYRGWSEALLVQVLGVCRHLGTSVTTEDLSWLTGALEHDTDAVRAAAARALGNLGWRQDLRDELFLRRLVQDPSPEVRSAVYGMLARWGDRRALAVLSDALAAEDDERARLAGANALVRHVDSEPEPEAEADSRALADTWAWSHEHAAFDRAVRRGGRREAS